MLFKGGDRALINNTNEKQKNKMIKNLTIAAIASVCQAIKLPPGLEHFLNNPEMNLDPFMEGQNNSGGLDLQALGFGITNGA